MFWFLLALLSPFLVLGLIFLLAFCVGIIIVLVTFLGLYFILDLKCSTFALTCHATRCCSSTTFDNLNTAPVLLYLPSPCGRHPSRHQEWFITHTQFADAWLTARRILQVTWCPSPWMDEHKEMYATDSILVCYPYWACIVKIEFCKRRIELSSSLKPSIIISLHRNVTVGCKDTSCLQDKLS